MGQKVNKCVKTESVDDNHRSDVLTLTENPPEQPRPLVGATEGDVSDNRDEGKKKKRFWRKLWKKSSSGRCVREELTKEQNTPEPSTADTRDHSPTLAADVHKEVDDKRVEEKKKKKMRFWKNLWRKNHKTFQSEREDQTDRSTEDGFQKNQETPDLQNETEDLSESGDLPASDLSSVCDSSDECFYTPALSLSDLHFNVCRHTVSSESIDSFHSAVCSLSDLLEDDKDVNNIQEINSCQYKMGRLLDEGGSGSVYEATRVSDGLKVAVKIVQPICPDFIYIPGYFYFLQREIALHILANEGAHIPEIIRLLDWDDNDDEYIMVLENFSPCMNLFDFIESKGGKITEDFAQIIMRQAVKATNECFKREVFHMDIKLENFLINTETFHIKLIDFGCADQLKETPYTTCLGTMQYCCPELENTGGYHALPATVWSLGLMLYIMMCWGLPGPDIQEKINNKKWKKDDLTKECCSLISACLQEDPDQRIQLKHILHHKWFQVSDVETQVRLLVVGGASELNFLYRENGTSQLSPLRTSPTPSHN